MRRTPGSEFVWINDDTFDEISLAPHELFAFVNIA
jgi:hypothetical protein